MVKSNHFDWIWHLCLYEIVIVINEFDKNDPWGDKWNEERVGTSEVKAEG